MKKIMLIDDDPDFVLIFSKRLEAAKYQVRTTLLNKDGIEKVKEENPDLIVLDCNMPEIDGFAALEILKRTFETKAIPVIMMSAHYMDEGTIDVARSLGAAEIFEKTEDLGLMVGKIHDFCEGGFKKKA